MQNVRREPKTACIHLTVNQEPIQNFNRKSTIFLLSKTKKHHIYPFYKLIVFPGMVPPSSFGKQ